MARTAGGQATGGGSLRNAAGFPGVSGRPDGARLGRRTRRARSNGPDPRERPARLRPAGVLLRVHSGGCVPENHRPAGEAGWVP